MEIIKAVLFGIVEGITEWLPVSSTGHMILLDEFVKLKGSADFVNVFLVVIQLGAIFAVVLQFWNQLFPFQFKDKNRPVIEMDKMILWGKILLACIPAAVIGILFDDVFEAMFYHAVPVAIALIVFGIAFIVIERWNKEKTADEDSGGSDNFGCADHRSLPVDCGNLSWNLPVRCHDCRRPAYRCIKKSGIRIYFLPCGSGYAWRKPFKSSSVWICL